MKLAVLAFVGLAASVPRDAPIDPRTIQSAVIYEMNVGTPTCRSILDGNSICASAGRHYDLKPSERDRLLAIVNARNSFDANARPSCAVPREAVVFETTTGRRAFDISLECNNVGGRAPTPATRMVLSGLLRGFGFVAHVPIIVE